MNSIIFVFLDGVGIGKPDTEYNPFFKYGSRTFTELFKQIPSIYEPVLNGKNMFLFPADATLGVSGLPQSGTGQTSIYCGMNAPEYVGKHFGPFPYSTLLPFLKEESLMNYFLSKGKNAVFANAYPKIFFDYVEKGTQRLTATTLMCLLNDIPLLTATDLRRGNAVSAEITNQRWKEKLNYSVPTIKARTAARRLLKLAQDNHFVLFEYFLTDHVGHGRYDGDEEQLFRDLDEFLYTLLTEYNASNTTIVVCSDHGNVEDLSVTTHTFNPVLMITAGKKAIELLHEIRNISHIKKAIVDELG